MEKVDYTEVDRHILKALNRGGRVYADICADKGVQLACIQTGDKRAWRVVDRRLQALRKKGAILYTRRSGWRVK